MKNNTDPDDVEFSNIWNECRPYTMTSIERARALFDAVGFIAKSNIPGDVVEMGVWRGGSSMIAIKAMQHFGIERDIWLFDTFGGMTTPNEVDVDFQGQPASLLMQATESDKREALIWAYASLEEVSASIAQTGYPKERVHFVIGDVLETIPKTINFPVCLLRLDTDFYDSTREELEYFYPRLSPQGVLLIDDYGHWKGCRLAVDEFFEALRSSGQPVPFLAAVDYTGRIANKPADFQKKINTRYDYYPPGLKHARLLSTVPTLKSRDPSDINWQYLRKSAPHIWRSEGRAKALPDTGVLSVEEAELLHANALPFSGKRGLEIGCHFGWSSAHLLAAGLELDIVDPALQDEAQSSDLVFSARLAAPQAVFRLWAAYSPSVVKAIQNLKPIKWSFAFIDGYHEGDAPLKDAIAVSSFCADDCCVMFHDLTSPHVAAGLHYFAYQGWNIGLYNTMQIMGIAWRGNCVPALHVQDSNMPAIDLPHLDKGMILSCSSGKETLRV